MILVSKSDIKNALGSISIQEILLPELRVFVLLCLREYYTRIGHNTENQESFIKQTADILIGDLRKHLGHLGHHEVKLAIEYGAQGVFGDPKHVSVSTFMQYITKYLTLDERKIAKSELLKSESDPLLLEVKTVWTVEERLRILDVRYLECWNLVVNGREPRDTGGLLWDFLASKALVEVTIQDIQEEYERKLEALMLNKFDTYTRDLLKHHRESVSKEEKSPLEPFAKARILKQYFQMEIEASELKRLEILNKKTA